MPPIPEPPSAARSARAAAEQGQPALATAWALIAISEDLADIRRDLHWQRQNTRSDARRG